MSNCLDLIYAEVRESRSLYVDIYIFCVVVSEEDIFFLLHIVLSNMNDFQQRFISLMKP